jgi:hypothetical protein
MLLMATFMFEPAKLQMNWARARGMSVLRKAVIEVTARPVAGCASIRLPIEASCCDRE